MGTRCIHCTRCIRFLSDVSGSSSFGMLGRSSNSEIGLYVSKNLNSYLSGNIIDLCPVGALTSKTDSLGSNIIISLKGSHVLRILPGINKSLNTEWISDKTRFFYDSFDNLRIKKCWSKSSGFLDWKNSVNYIYLNIVSI